MEKPIEDTYVTELVSVIKHIASAIGFDAESNWNTPSGKPDIKLYYKGKVVAVIEVKRPKIPLSDPKLNSQALNYADWYRENHRVGFYGIHNMKYLKLFKFVAEEKPKKTLLDFMGQKKVDWAPVSDFPFKIMPWVKSIDEYKQISTNKQAQENLEQFMLRFKEFLEGKTLDLSSDVIETVRRYIEEAANKGLTKMEYLYKSKMENVSELFEAWRKERGIKKPRNDNQLREYLTLMMKEQHYTFSMKVLFYFVLQSIDTQMGMKLKENLAAIEPSDSEVFKEIFGLLFSYAIDRTGDFEEVFGTNSVDKLPFMDATLQPLKNLISYLGQIRWSEINVDIIGRIFEGLIYAERRHLLGQHYTDTMVVDLILTATLGKPDKLIDPACGSGTFLVRALNYWKTNYRSNGENFRLVEGIDIDKLASMLSKINLYIQGLKEIENRSEYFPRIHQDDFFKAKLSPDYSYVTANPPYTRQEEMAMAFYDRNYKKNLMKAVDDISDWSKRASIYAYFLVQGAKLLKEGGRLGFIVENSWLNADYGGPLKEWFLDNFTIQFIVESLVERWFEDAKVITNIIIAENAKKLDYVTAFIFLNKRLEKLFGAPPPASDYVANQRYYEKISQLLSTAMKISPNDDYQTDENDNLRITAVKKSMLEKIEEKLGSWGILKGPKKYLEIVMKFVKDEDTALKKLDDVLSIERGLTTNANEIFYLPSKHWRYLDENEKFLTIGGPTHKALKISKHYLRPLIRPAHIENSPYGVLDLAKKRQEDYVLWVSDTSKVKDQGTQDYIEWVRRFVKEEHETDNSRFQTIIKQLESPTWTKLPDKSGARFFFKNDIHKNFVIRSNKISNAQVDKRLFLGHTKLSIEERIIFGVLNSVFTYLGMELIGRTNLGEGALDVNVVDYKKIPIVDPVTVKDELEEDGNLQAFLKTVDKIVTMNPNDLELEAQNDIRLEMEEYILRTIGLDEKDIADLYTELLSLVNLRAERAASVKKKI